MKFLLVFAVVLLLSPSIMAQEYLDTPICFTVKNNAPYKIYGEIQTAPDVYKGKLDFKNETITHTATIRLAPDESTPVCTTGPLFEGNKVRIKLRSLFPIFECKSMIYQGAEIKIQGRFLENGRDTETWAECL